MYESPILAHARKRAEAMARQAHVEATQVRTCSQCGTTDLEDVSGSYSTCCDKRVEYRPVDVDAHDCQMCGMTILPVGRELWIESDGVLVPVCSLTCEGEG